MAACYNEDKNGKGGDPVERIMNTIMKIYRKMQSRGMSKRVSTAIAGLVVFVTVYSLILPALTLENKVAATMPGLDTGAETQPVLACEYEVHTHTDDCYADVPVYDADGKQNGTERVLTCGKADYVVHHHDENCYQTVLKTVVEDVKEQIVEEKELVCTLPETEAHVHSDSCYKTEKILSCGKEESEDHKHTDKCYKEQKTLICSEPVLHRHSEKCYEKDHNGDANYLICGKPELLAHQHDEACFKEAAVETQQSGSPEVDSQPAESFETDSKSDESIGLDAQQSSLLGADSISDKDDGADTSQEDGRADAAAEADINAVEESLSETDAENVGESASGTDDKNVGESVSGTGADFGAEPAAGEGRTADASGTEAGKDSGQTAMPSDPSEPLEPSEPSDPSEPSEPLESSESSGPKDTVVTPGQIWNQVQENAQTSDSETEGDDFYTIDVLGDDESREGEVEDSQDSHGSNDKEDTEKTPDLQDEEDLKAREKDYKNPAEEAGVIDIPVEGASYRLQIDCGSDSGIPENAVVKAVSLTESDTEYDAWSQKAIAAVSDIKKEADQAEHSVLGLFDLSIYDAEGSKIQPVNPVTVTVDFGSQIDSSQKKIYAVHFPGSELQDTPFAEKSTYAQAFGKRLAKSRLFNDVQISGGQTSADTAGADPEVIDTDYNGQAVEKVQFQADSFSVYVIVGTVIEKTVLASDGNYYKVTVTCPPDSGIPEGAELEVNEITSESSVYGKSYAEYVAYTENALGMEEGSAGYIRLFDIKIVDRDGNKIQPAAGSTVDVRIELADAEDGKDLSVVHFADDNDIGSVVNAEVDGPTVSFETSGFSIYAIVDKNDDQSVARAKIVFQNADGTEYTFLNNAGNSVDNQIIRSGSVLEEVGIPAIDVNGQTFQGWYIYDVANNTYTSYQLKFGEGNTWTISYGDTKSATSNAAVVTSEDVDNDGCVFYARPYFGEVSYLTFYNECAGDNAGLGGHGIILNRVQVIKGTTYDISEQQATPPDSIWNEQTQTWEPVSYVFTGWSNTAGTDDDDRQAITNTTITVNGDQSFYPIFKQGHWVTYDSAPTGSGATYIPAKIVLSTETTSVARPAVTPTWKGHTFVGWFTTPENYDPDNANYYNANGTINTAYNGYFSTNETTTGAYRFNESLDEDLTLYAHWNVDTANVTVVKWQQVVTDDKNATTPTKEQMAAEGYASNTGLKHYEYAGQQNLDETVNSILRNNDGDITVPTGFNLNSTLSDAQVVVKDDGTAVLNLYYDRNLITLNFDRDIETYRESDNGTYGLVNGEYVSLTNNNGQWTYNTTQTAYWTGTRYYQSTGGNDQHYGIVNGELVPVYYRNFSWRLTNSNNGTQYTGNVYRVRTNNDTPSYAFIDGEMVELTRGGTNQNRTWSYTTTVQNDYSGPRYARSTTRSFTGLYGQTLAQNGYEWPSSIGWQYSGYNYESGRWVAGTYSMSYLGQFVVPPNRFNGANDTVTTIDFTNRSASNTIYYYIQNEDGTWPGEGEYIDAGLTAATTIQIAEKFDGFTMDAYEYNNNGRGAAYTANNANWTSVSPGETAKTVNDGMAIRYRRLSYTVKFLDSRDGSELDDVDNVQVMYGASMSTANPGDDVSITNANTQYVWDGKWYKDQACTEEFNFNDSMPNHDVAVYAGWKEVWYWVKIDPNGGVLPSTEATWFWEPYGGVVEEYHNITRGFVEDDDGEYYYHVDVLDPETELNQYGTNVRKAEYRLKSENPNWEQDSLDGKSYKVDDANTYVLVGWYKVNDDGTLEPYNFSSPVTDNLTLRALWRVVGEYHVRYSVEGVDAEGNPLYVKDAEGNPTTDRLLGTNAPSDSNKYADKSSSSILGPDNPPTGYTFVGWYYNGHVYNPGDTFIVDADLADDNKDVWVYPVYLAIEDQPVATTHIPFVGNGGTTTKSDGSDDEWAWEVSADNDRINFVNVQPNVSFSLEESPTYFTRNGYNFVGWGKRTEGQTTTANNFLEYRDGKFFLVGKQTEASEIAADEFQPYEELYALWEPKNYSVTVVKDVSSTVAGDNEFPFVFTPSFPTMSGTEYQTNFSLVGKEGGTRVTYIDEDENEVTVIYDHSKTYMEIPYGTSFSFTEGFYENYDLANVKYTVTGADDTSKNVTDQSSSNGATITVDGNVTVTFTNVPKTGILLINKVIDPNGIADSDKTFPVTVQNSEGKYLQSVSDISFGDSAPETPLSVPVNGGLSITNLPADTYTVSELIRTGDDDTSLVDIEGYRYDGNEIVYAVESETIEAGTVRANSTTTATITNKYTKLVDVTVTKTLVDSTSTGTKEFLFTATLTEGADDISDYLGTIEEGKTTYAFSLSPSNDTPENAVVSKVFTGIPVGAVLTVTETADSNYDTQVSVSGAEAVDSTEGELTVSDTNNTIEFTNTRKITEIVIKKEDNAGHALSGAEFTLLSLDTSSPTIVTTLKIGETTHENGVISMEDVSKITISNLATGNYRLVETHAPDGYVILTRGVDFSIDASNGTVTLVKESTDTVEDETVTTYVPADVDDYPDASANGNTITVKNTPGAALPNTGGPGTSLIYLLGAILTAFAGMGLVMRKRRRA